MELSLSLEKILYQRRPAELLEKGFRGEIFRGKKLFVYLFFLSNQSNNKKGCFYNKLNRFTNNII